MRCVGHCAHAPPLRLPPPLQTACMRGYSKQRPRFTALTYAHYDNKTSSKSFCAHYTEEGHASCGRRLEQANFPSTKGAHIPIFSSPFPLFLSIFLHLVAHTICRSICDRLLCGESEAYALDDGDAVVQRKLYCESFLPRTTPSSLVQNASRCVANCSILCEAGRISCGGPRPCDWRKIACNAYIITLPDRDSSP